MTTEIADHVAARVPPEQEGRAARRGRLRPADRSRAGRTRSTISHIAVQQAATERQGHPGRPVGEHLDRCSSAASAAELLDRLGPAERDPRPARPPRGARGRALHVQVRAGDHSRSWRSCRRRPAQTAVDAPLPAEGATSRSSSPQPLRKTLPLVRRRRCRPTPDTQGGGDDRQADAPGGLLVQAASSSRTRAPCSS